METWYRWEYRELKKIIAEKSSHEFITLNNKISTRIKKDGPDYKSGQNFEEMKNHAINWLINEIKYHEEYVEKLKTKLNHIYNLTEETI